MKYRHQFESEIRQLANRCNEIKPRTFKKYLREVLNNYSELIIFNTDSLKNRDESISHLRRCVHCLRIGKIDYEGGFIFISEISSIETLNESINVHLKTGHIISFGKEWKELFDDIIF